MRSGIFCAFLFTALSASAQLVSLIAPAPNTHIPAGQSFTATVALQSTTSSVDVIALFFGAKAPGDPQEDDLGQTNLKIVVAPQFGSTGPQGQIVQNVELSFPTTLINGLDRTYNLTVGEFYTLGAENTPLTHTSQVPIFVTSA